jgi:ketosteroid isomerase-like protein
MTMWQKLRGLVGLAGALALATLLTVVSTPSGAGTMSEPSWPSDSTAVRATLGRFLTAFENLDWEPFRSAFSDSATVFHPAPDMPERVAGRRAIEESFAKVFAGIKAAGPDTPPYHHLHAEDVETRRLGPNAVLVSFQLRNAERLGRRTVIFQREAGGWRIVHLHASNIPRVPGSR